jgi:hypothetical protein
MALVSAARSGPAGQAPVATEPAADGRNGAVLDGDGIDSELDPDDYLTRFFDTGTERQGAVST